MKKINEKLILEKMLLAALEARKAILKIYQQDDFQVEIKDDLSPVTIADKASNEIIVNLLKKEFPAFAILTEESEDDLSRLKNDYVFIIDPLDGTKDFIARNNQFTINIALAINHIPFIGVIDLPMQNETYFAIKNQGAYLKKNAEIIPLKVNKKIRDLTVFTSNFHLNDLEIQMIDKHRDIIKNVVAIGSSIKGCYIASGKGELSYRFSSNTKEWDTCAMQIIVEEAGGFLVNQEGQPLRYNREDVYNRGGYIICNSLDNLLL